MVVCSAVQSLYASLFASIASLYAFSEASRAAFMSSQQSASAYFSTVHCVLAMVHSEILQMSAPASVEQSVRVFVHSWAPSVAFVASHFASATPARARHTRTWRRRLAIVVVVEKVGSSVRVGLAWC